MRSPWNGGSSALRSAMWSGPSSSRTLRGPSSGLSTWLPSPACSTPGRPEDVITAAAHDADVLVLVRDGRGSDPGPHSIGHATRFILDHAPCTVLLAWP